MLLNGQFFWWCEWVLFWSFFFTAIPSNYYGYNKQAEIFFHKYYLNWFR